MYLVTCTYTYIHILYRVAGRITLDSSMLVNLTQYGAYQLDLPLPLRRETTYADDFWCLKARKTCDYIPHCSSSSSSAAEHHWHEAAKCWKEITTTTPSSESSTSTPATHAASVSRAHSRKISSLQSDL